jgi:uncharacterized damage-inducible protein DinB
MKEQEAMIAEQMRKLFAYNSWAWQRVFTSVEKLDETTYRAERPIFYNTIHGLLVHAMSAEYLWLSRCRGHSPDTVLQPEEYADFAGVRDHWSKIGHSWGNFLQGLNDAHCERVINYLNTRGEPYSQTLVDILQHVVNHSTEHRSQLTPILYKSGVPTQPLDYILFQTRRYGS